MVKELAVVVKSGYDRLGSVHVITYQGWKLWILLAIYPWQVNCGYTLIRGVLGRAAYIPDCMPQMMLTAMSLLSLLLTAGVRG